jgi:ferredoxin
MNRTQELRSLKLRADRLEARLNALNLKLGKAKRRPPTRTARALVDESSCLACGSCEAVCPTGAVKVAETAHVDQARCLGCGRCVEACPAGAISLVSYPMSTRTDFSTLKKPPSSLRGPGAQRGRRSP